MSAYIEMVGSGVGAMRYDLTNVELRGIGEFTRKNVSMWIENHYTDMGVWMAVLPVEDFHAVCGDIDIPWATEAGKSRWADAAPHPN